MIFKVFISATPPNKKDSMHFCEVFAVENGSRLEERIAHKISNLRADGFVDVRVLDCFNISEPTSQH